MSTRRGFFAFIGNAAVTGLVAHRASVAKPTLILPSTGLVDPPPPLPKGYPLLMAKMEQGGVMAALLEIKLNMPDELYLDWLEGGLRVAEGCKPGGLVYRAMAIERGEL